MNTQQQPKASTTTANAEGGEEQAFLAEVRKLEDTARLYQSEVIKTLILTPLSIEQIC